MDEWLEKPLSAAVATLGKCWLCTGQANLAKVWFERSLTEIVSVALALGSDHFQLRSVEARSNKEERGVRR